VTFEKAILGLCVAVEQAGCQVAGKILAHLADGIACPLPDARGALWVVSLQFLQGALQTPGIEQRDRERPDAALDAAGPARQVRSGARCTLCQRPLEILQQLPVCGFPVRHPR
jgi:hypothetical protein